MREDRQLLEVLRVVEVLRPSEAHALDPQQRLLLMKTYGALAAEFGDLPGGRAQLSGAAVGVCVGLMSCDAAAALDVVDVGPHDLTGNGYAAAGSRLSFLLDLKGPALVVDTACSGALVAADLGARAVRVGSS